MTRREKRQLATITEAQLHIQRHIATTHGAQARAVDPNPNPGTSLLERVFVAHWDAHARVAEPDALIPLSEQKNVYDILKKNGKNVSFIPINDKHGHDAMFNAKVCSDKFAPVISSFIEADGEALEQTHLKREEIKETSRP